MNIDKDQILDLLRSQGKHDEAGSAADQLPDKVDTEDSNHADLLSRFGVEPAELKDKLGGLGKLI